MVFVPATATAVASAAASAWSSDLVGRCYDHLGAMHTREENGCPTRVANPLISNALLAKLNFAKALTNEMRRGTLDQRALQSFQSSFAVGAAAVIGETVAKTLHKRPLALFSALFYTATAIALVFAKL
jgi:hypothetical protein